MITTWLLGFIYFFFISITKILFWNQVALEKQTKEIEAKHKDVMADLAQVEPAVIEAQNGLVLNLFCYSSVMSIVYLKTLLLYDKITWKKEFLFMLEFCGTMC